MIELLAWTPLLDPMPGIAGWWWVLVFPLSLFISMTWKAVRVEALQGYWPAVLKMSAQVILGMLGLFGALTVVIRVVVPMISAE